MVIIVAVHGKADPTQEEWDAFLELCGKTRTAARNGTLVVTDGGAPNAKQRGKLNELVTNMPTKPISFIVTDSSLVRGVVTALSWFNPNNRALRPSDYKTAFDAWKLSREDQASVIGSLKASTVSSVVAALITDYATRAA